MNDILNIIPAKYHGLALFVLAISPYITRALHSLMSGGGLRGIFAAIWLGTNTPLPKGTMENPAQIKLPLAITLLFAVATFALLMTSGCAHIQPGNDPLVVRVEQTETIAKTTFDQVLAIDNSNRIFFGKNAPDFHKFCEWLRAPQQISPGDSLTIGTNALPRCSAMLFSLDDVKRSYKLAGASSNDVFTALQTVTSAMGQANVWLTSGVATNSTPQIQ
jgi:hypothetical protein